MRSSFLKKSKAVFAALATTAALLSSVLIAGPASAATPTATSTSTTLVAPTGNTSLSSVAVTGFTSETLLVNVSTTIGSLSMTTTSGLTLSYGYSSFSGSTLSFTGTQANVNAGLATLKYVGNGSTGTANIALNVTINQSGISYLPSTGHFYQYVASSGGTWTAAKSAAQSRTFNGQTGYLATIPSTAVNAFIQGKLNGAQNVWAGGKSTDNSGATIKRNWTWQGGPISGDSFTKCTNLTGGCTHSGDTGAFYDWNSGEPNNSSSNEQYLEINYQGNSHWNDLANTNTETSGYVVEYGDQVTGGNFTGVYADSNSVTVAAAPGAPTSVSGTRGDSQVALTWTAPASNGGAAITGYKVTPYIGATAQTAEVFNTNATSQTITGLTNGTAYTFKVAATNAAGTGSDSTASSAITPAGLPAAPTAVTATSGAGQASVSWTAPASNGAAITGYKVTPYIGSAAQAQQTFNSTATTQTVTGLANGNAYTFTVAAINGVGTGAPSVASSAITPAIGPAFTAYSPPSAVSGVPYSYTFSANGSPSPTYAVASGILPTGLSLNTTTGALSGTPSSSGTFTISATNAGGTVTTPSLTITSSASATPVLTAKNPPPATTGRAYSYTFTATGNPPPTFVVQSGTLPAGLSLNATTGVLSGTPTASGTFTIRAVNAVGNDTSAGITIVAGPPAAPVFGPYTLPSAVTSVPFTYTFPTTGSPLPTFNVQSGSLPAGLTLDANTGTISGTPTGASGTFTIRAVNAIGNATTQSITITPTAAVAPAVTGANPPAATVGIPYEYTFTSTGNPAPTFGLLSGTLPAGLTLDPISGVLSGTPTTPGNSTFSVSVSNSVFSTFTDAITVITSAQAGPAFNLAPIPQAVNGVAFSYTFTASGSPAPTYSVASGSLPTGLTLNSTTGVLSGTPTTAGTFTVTATNAVGSITTQSITIDPAPAAAPVFIDYSPPPSATGVAYSYTFTATGTPAPTFAVDSGSLPAGLTLDPNTGELSGTPTSASTFTISATNTVTSVVTPSITITNDPAAAPVFVNANPPAATIGTPYSYTFTTTGLPLPTYSVASGSLPTGLTLDTNTGVISGTPTATNSFQISATNSAGTATTQSITIVANAPAVPVFTGPINPPPAVTGTPYIFTFPVSGSPLPVFSVDSGSLPTGLTLDANTGVISGTPTSSGTFTIKVTNSQGSVTTPSLTINTAVASAPAFIAANPPAGTSSQTYSYQFVATGNLPPTYTVASGSLPTGLTLNATTGILTGTPSASGTFTISATNTSGTATTSAITILVSAPATPVFTSASPSTSPVNGLAYSYSFIASGSPAPTYAVASGALPTGLTLDTTTGLLAGTPSSNGTYTFTISATNNQGSATSSSIAMVVNSGAAPTFVSTTAPDATETLPYSFAIGVTANPLPTFAIASGSLPGGLSLNTSTGVILGTPAGTGTFNFTVTATNAVGSLTSGTITITTNALANPVFINASPPAQAITTVPYSYAFTTTGTPAPTFALSTGTLPTGLTLDTTTGVLSGTPTATGSFTFVISSTNSASTETTSSITIDVSAPLAPTFTASSPSTKATETYAYNYTFAATGVPAPTFSVASGTLPTGMTLDSTTGVLSGTPTAAGNYEFIIAATNTFGSVATSPINVVVSSPAAPVLTPGSTPPAALTGQPYSYTFPVTGSPAPTFSVATGTLPAGLTLDPNTGTISGMPTGSGTFTIGITNALGTVTTQTISISVAPSQTPVFTAKAPPVAYSTLSYNYQFAVNANPTAAFAVTSGSLPAGLTLDPNTGVLSGTPTTTGNYSFTITATNSSGTSNTGSINIETRAVSTPAITTLTAVPDARAGQPFTYQIGATGSPAPTFSIGSGSLPPGVTLNSNTGALSGTPTSAGSYTFTVKVTNALGVSETSAITVVVSVPLVDAPTGGATAATPSGDGYWAISPTGDLTAVGNAPNLGSKDAADINQPIVGIAATGAGDGYWEVASDGGVFPFGVAGFHGSMGGQSLNQPVVGISGTKDSGGYWLVARDGGIFAFGNAGFFGSMGGAPLNKEIVGMTSTPTGKGYWLVASDGGVFAFGDAQFFGSLGSITLNKPIVGMAVTPDGGGYWLVASDGGVFAFGNAKFFGSLGASGDVKISGIVATGNTGYRLIDTAGKAHPFGTV